MKQLFATRFRLLFGAAVVAAVFVVAAVIESSPTVAAYCSGPPSFEARSCFDAEGNIIGHPARGLTSANTLRIAGGILALLWLHVAFAFAHERLLRRTIPEAVRGLRWLRGSAVLIVGMFAAAVLVESLVGLPNNGCVYPVGSGRGHCSSHAYAQPGEFLAGVLWFAGGVLAIAWALAAVVLVWRGVVVHRRHRDGHERDVQTNSDSSP